MKSSTTIITAYFDIGRGDWTANKGFREKLARSVDVYFSYFERLAALENEMIIFFSRFETKGWSDSQRKTNNGYRYRYKKEI